MALDWHEIAALAAKHGESFFVLSAPKFRSNFEELRGSFLAHYPDVNIGYSYKTNYTPQLCRLVHELGGYAEVVSEMEYALAKRLSVPDERIIFNGPYKAEWAFRSALLNGATINLDSHRDLKMMQEIASSHMDQDLAVVIRTNFALNNEGISRFGMDIDGADFATALTMIADQPNLRLKGLHCHFPDRDLESFRQRATTIVELVGRIFGEKLPETINIGGGFFSHMPESLRSQFNVPPATFQDYGACVGRILSEAFVGQGKKPPALFLEPGTAIVADTQSFYTRIISTKAIRGKRFATVAGSSFDISPTARSRTLPVTPVLQEPREDMGAAFDIVGYTCIEKDILSENLVAPLEAGDFLRYDNVGSYSVVMRPPFILPANPVLFDTGDALELIKTRQTNEEVFQNFRL